GIRGSGSTSTTATHWPSWRSSEPTATVGRPRPGAWRPLWRCTNRTPTTESAPGGPPGTAGTYAAGPSDSPSEEARARRPGPVRCRHAPDEPAGGSGLDRYRCPVGVIQTSVPSGSRTTFHRFDVL